MGRAAEPAPVVVEQQAAQRAFAAVSSTRHAAVPAPAIAGPVVFGRVLDAGGAVVPGATLTLISTSGQQLGRSVAGADGTYELTAPADGSYVLIGSAEGRRPDASTVTLGSQPVSCDVTLTGMGALAGTVMRTPGDDPVPDARVAALDPRGEVVGSTETDILGRFSLVDLPEGEFTIAVSATGFHPTAVPTPVSGTGITEITILLRPGARLSGVVRTHRDDGPLDDAQVTLMDPAGHVVDAMTTGPDGAYTFTNLSDGDYTVVVSGYAPVVMQVNVHGTTVDGVDAHLGHDAPATPPIPLDAQPSNRG
ncbi:MSCRAMM family protein [Nocardia alni]|uniref:MSCRAMM family protein n=1 Tax=Nocardia alni TaxID=2815723 RepID=UPI003F685670